MADKPGKPKGSKPSDKIIFMLIGFFAAYTFLSYIYERLVFWWSGPAQDSAREVISGGLNVLEMLGKALALLVSVLAVIGIIYLTKKMGDLEEEEKDLYGDVSTPEQFGDEEYVKNGKWEHVIELINSANSSDWKLAIIEADIMLEDLLRSAGYHGETIGDMLKSVEKSDFLTLDAAWEAHKIRNHIAHSGSDYLLNERNAKHAVALFETVFREFKII